MSYTFSTNLGVNVYGSDATIDTTVPLLNYAQKLTVSSSPDTYYQTRVSLGAAATTSLTLPVLTSSVNYVLIKVASTTDVGTAASASFTYTIVGTTTSVSAYIPAGGFLLIPQVSIKLSVAPVLAYNTLTTTAPTDVIYF